MPLRNLVHSNLKIDLDRDSVSLLQVLFRFHNPTITKVVTSEEYIASTDILYVVSKDEYGNYQVVNPDSPILDEISSCFGIGINEAYLLYNRFESKIFGK